MKLLVDAQLPPALAVVLREAGCDAVAVREVGLWEAKDAAGSNPTSPTRLSSWESVGCP